MQQPHRTDLGEDGDQPKQQKMSKFVVKLRTLSQMRGEGYIKGDEYPNAPWLVLSLGLGGPSLLLLGEIGHPSK